jgi:hypothetical protein
MVSLVYSGVADIGIGEFIEAKATSEVDAFTDTVGLAW